MADEIMEFRLINPTEGNFLRHIEWNKEQLKEAVKAKMETYQNVVYTEDTMGDAKKDRAELNALIKAIEDKRKEVKKIVNQPYDEFEREVKEVLALIREPVELIDKQVKDFEEQQRQEKRKYLKAAYDEFIGELKDVLPFEKVFDNRYLNKTYKLETATLEIKETIQRVKTDLESIDSLDSKYKLNAKDVYIQTMDLSAAMAENKRLLELEEKLEADRIKKEEARKREEEEARRKEEEAKRAKEQETEQAKPEQEPQQETQEESKPEEPQEEIPEEKKYRIRFEAIGTREQLEALVKFMDDNGIERNKI